jgi:hypothetical protein
MKKRFEQQPLEFTADMAGATEKAAIPPGLTIVISVVVARARVFVDQNL